MAWIQTAATIDTQEAEDIILAFIAANQADALFYYNNGQALKPFVFLADVIAKPDLPGLPSLEVASESEQTTELETLLQLDYQIRFESVVTHTDAGAVKRLAKTYANALKAMLASIPATSLITPGAGAVTDEHFSPGVSYGAVLSNDAETAFFLRFSIEANYRVLMTY